VEVEVLAVAGEVATDVEDVAGVDALAPQPARPRTSPTISAAAPPGRLAMRYVVRPAAAAIEREMSSTGW
jgi:hypothetical protein